MNDMESLGLSESTFISKLIVAKTDGHDECEDGQCLEVQSAVNYAVWNPGPNRVVLIIRDIAGGQKVFIKTNDPRLVLGTLSMTSAVEEAGSGETEQHFLLQDIATGDNPGFQLVDIDDGYSIVQYASNSVDIPSWISIHFGASSSEFKVTATALIVQEDRWMWQMWYGAWGPLPRSTCTFRGDGFAEGCVLFLCPNTEYDIVVTKVTADSDGSHDDPNPVIPAVTDSLFGAEGVVSQTHGGIVQHPSAGFAIAFAIGCALIAVYMMITKKMRPRAARRRVMAPRTALLAQNRMLDDGRNQSAYTTMADAV